MDDLRWTKETPATPGYYWVRGEVDGDRFLSHSHPRVALVAVTHRFMDRPSSGEVYTVDIEARDPYEEWGNEDCHKFEWAGPIPMPVEPKEDGDAR